MSLLRGSVRFIALAAVHAGLPLAVGVLYTCFKPSVETRLAEQHLLLSRLIHEVEKRHIYDPQPLRKSSWRPMFGLSLVNLDSLLTDSVFGLHQLKRLSVQLLHHVHQFVSDCVRLLFGSGHVGF